MASRRKFLGLAAIGAVAVGAPLVATAINSRAFAADGLPMTVVNSSGTFGNGEIFMYIVGTELATGRQATSSRAASSRPARRRTTARTVSPTSRSR